jgi:hypothetical protein
MHVRVIEITWQMSPELSLKWMRRSLSLPRKA